MIYEERTIKSDKLYEGKILNLRVDTVEIPEKMYSKREIVEHPGSVGIIPIVDGDSLILVKQYRKAVEDFLYEIPAGKMEPGEEPKETAIRELREETGMEGEKMEYILEFYPSPGFSTENIYLFLADNLVDVGGVPDEGEHLEKYVFKIDELEKMIKRGKIVDSKTIIGINLARSYLEENKAIKE